MFQNLNRQWVKELIQISWELEDISKNISDYDEDVDEEQEDIAFLNNDIDEYRQITSGIKQKSKQE